MRARPPIRAHGYDIAQSQLPLRSLRVIRAGDGLANLAVLTLDDCCYVADRRALRSHLSTCMRDVRFIAFPAEGPHWAERTGEGRFCAGSQRTAMGL